MGCAFGLNTPAHGMHKLWSEKSTEHRWTYCCPGTGAGLWEALSVTSWTEGVGEDRLAHFTSAPHHLQVLKPGFSRQPQLSQSFSVVPLTSLNDSNHRHAKQTMAESINASTSSTGHDGSVITSITFQPVMTAKHSATQTHHRRES